MKKILSLILGSVLGYAIYYFLLMELAVRFFYTNSGLSYYVISLLLLFFSIIGCTFILNMIFERKMDKKMIALLSISYFSILFFALFYRHTLERGFILNPLISLEEINTPEMLMESLLNIIVFIPMGYYFRNAKKHKTVLISASLISVFIELVQGITQRGFFDTFDIILYILGIYFGFLLCKKIELLIQNSGKKTIKITKTRLIKGLIRLPPA